MQLKEHNDLEFNETIPAYNQRYIRNIQRLLRYRKYMHDLYKVSFLFNDLSADFGAIRQIDGMKAANDLKGAVFLAKNSTALKLLDVNGIDLGENAKPENIQKVIITYNDYYDVEFVPGKADKKELDSFTIKNLKHDYMDTDASVATYAFLEQAKAAMILVQTAKEAGWTKVDFGNTSDPLQRYMLQRACKIFALDCSSEHINPQDIQHNKVFDQTMVEIAEEQFKVICEVIYRAPTSKNETKTSTSDAPIPVASNDDGNALADAYRKRHQNRPRFVA